MFYHTRHHLLFHPAGSLVTATDFVRRTGAGKKRRQIKTVQGRITNGNLFPPMVVLIRMDLRKLVSEMKKDLKRVVKGVLQLAKLDVYIIYDEHDDVEEEDEENEDEESEDEESEDEEGEVEGGGGEDDGDEDDEGEDNEDDDDSEGALTVADILQDKLPDLEVELLNVHNAVARLL